MSRHCGRLERRARGYRGTCGDQRREERGATRLLGRGSITSRARSVRSSTVGASSRRLTCQAANRMVNVWTGLVIVDRRGLTFKSLYKPSDFRRSYMNLCMSQTASQLSWRLLSAAVPHGARPGGRWLPCDCGVDSHTLCGSRMNRVLCGTVSGSVRLSRGVS